jgi:diaminohydroxyphosphoribosylaminopyrimidine deaminase/5-amino-6-(5-phosphoribosylamino)uracil reductase
MAQFTAADRRWMRRALALARRGWGRTAPNPMVGAVLVRDGGVVGEGWHAEYGAAHAEVMALEAAGVRARDATAYVTLEPCNHTGQTPPCTAALVGAGVRRVVYAVDDPNPEATGGGAALRAAGIRADAGACADEAIELNAAFHHRFASDRPFVTLKLAISLDGAVADATHRTGWLTGERARRVVHRMRAGHDAIAVGSGTALADDPRLTVRGVRKPRVAPLRVVFDRRARLPVTSRLVRTASRTPTVVITSVPAPDAADVLAGHGVQLLGASSVLEALRALRDRRVYSVLCEGGAELAGALLAAGAVDRLVMFQAPVVLGIGALNAFAFAPAHSLASAPRWRLVQRTQIDDDTMTIYAPAT